MSRVPARPVLHALVGLLLATSPAFAEGLPLRVRGPLERPQVTPDLKASDLLQGVLPKPEDLLKDPKKALDEAKKLKDRWKELLPR